MKYVVFLAPLSALALAACGSEAEEPQSFEDVAEKAASLDQPLPGEYSSTMELTEISMPGQPKSVTDQMKSMMGDRFSTTSTSCVTQEQIDKGFKDRFQNMGEEMQGSNCNFERFDVDGGDLDAQMACTAPGGVSTNITMTGDIEPEQQTVDMAMDISGPQEMSMKLKVVSKRIGDCS